MKTATPSHICVKEGLTSKVVLGGDRVQSGPDTDFSDGHIGIHLYQNAKCTGESQFRPVDSEEKFCKGCLDFCGKQWRDGTLFGSIGAKVYVYPPNLPN